MEIRTIIGKAKENERRSMELIQTKLTCARQSLEVPPKGLNPDDMASYIKGCVDALGEYQWLEKQFWHEAFEQYKFKDSGYETVYLDLDSGDFYILTK